LRPTGGPLEANRRLHGGLLETNHPAYIVASRNVQISSHLLFHNNSPNNSELVRALRWIWDQTTRMPGATALHLERPQAAAPVFLSNFFIIFRRTLRAIIIGSMTGEAVYTSAQLFKLWHLRLAEQHLRSFTFPYLEPRVFFHIQTPKDPVNRFVRIFCTRPKSWFSTNFDCSQIHNLLISLSQ